MWRHVVSNALSFFAIGLFLLGGIIMMGRGMYSEPGPLTSAMCLKVERGSSMSRVANDLESAGAVTNARIFRMGVDYSDKAQDLKAGSFVIPSGASMQEITDTITSPGRSTCGTEIVYRIGVTRASVQLRELDPETNRFVQLETFELGSDEPSADYARLIDDSGTRLRLTVAEGATSWQIVETLKSIDILTGSIENLPPEGRLAPDSYELKAGDDRAAVLARMSAAQTRRLDEVWAAKTDDTPVQSAEELLILASIIEKETGIAGERRQVASVFANRLKRGMKLQTDPTVIYGITKGQGALGRGLRRSELRKETPWNTYVIPALPPTPIANPGRASLEAAANPDSTEYIFFVADGTGGHAFATNLDDHNRNVAEWRKIEAERE